VPDDYLWDQSGVPDPEVQRLEQLLGTLRHTPSIPFDAPDIIAPDATFRASQQGSSGRAVMLLIAASLIAAVGAGWFVASSAAPRPAWEVSSLEGAPKIASTEIGGNGRLSVGEWLETGATGRARIAVGDIGRVDVDPQSRLRASSSETGNYRLRLVRGTMHAFIWAPPGQFFVDTPSSTAVDLGCAYTLRVADDGAGTVEVTSGWVGFEWKGRESFIPAGAVCATRPGIGPGTPHYASASPALQAALARFDFEQVSPAERARAVRTILAEAQSADAVTLWHLLQRVAPDDRERVFDRLAAFVPPPEGVTRDGVRAGQRDMLDRWWDALGLGSMQLWRHWQQGWRDR
jgi:FecR-like protein